ncbi:MAG: hypothetical protein QXJ48_07125 [Candidatus Korarchaeum sp.]
MRAVEHSSVGGALQIPRQLSSLSATLRISLASSDPSCGLTTVNQPRDLIAQLTVSGTSIHLIERFLL